MDKIKKASIDAMREALDKGAPETFTKAGITQSTGLVTYDLRAPALLHVPFLTPLREMLGRKTRPNPGTACNWKVINSVVGSGIDSMGYVFEGQRAGVKGVTSIDSMAKYVTLGEEGAISDEAVLAGKGLEDVESVDRLLTMEKLMVKEEMANLSGNRNVRLGTPGAVTTSSPTVAGATLAANNYYVAVVALTNEGYAVSSLTAGVPTALTVTGAEGSTFTLNGGSSNKSAISAAQAITLGQGLGVTVPAVRGAVAYAWFVGLTGTANALYLQAITTLNSVLLTTPILTTTQTSDQITSDHSYNDGTGSGSKQIAAYDGLMTSAFNVNNGAYYYSMPTGVAGTGTQLTADGAGGIVEIKNMFKTMWNGYRIAVDTLIMSANTADAVFTKILTNASAPLLQITRGLSDGNGDLVGGGFASGYFSPIANPYGNVKARILVHPNLPDGVILGWASQLPSWYKNNETPAVAEVLCRRDYYSSDWPRRTRTTEYGVYTDQCLAVYAPWAMGVITNIAV